MIFLSRLSTSSRDQEIRSAFWLCSSAETATPPALAALGRPEKDATGLELALRLQGAGHVGAFRESDQAVREQLLGVVTTDLVLGGSGERERARNDPRPLARMEVTAEFLGIGTDPPARDLLELFEPLELLVTNTVPVVNEAAGV